MNTFAKAVLDRINELGWKNADLARAAGLTTGGLSNILNGHRVPEPMTVLTIARALEEPPIKYFRLMGWLPTDPELTEEEERLVNVFRQLPDVEREIVLKMVYGLRKQSSKPVETSAIILQARTVESSLRLSPTIDDIDKIHELLDSYHRHQVYDFALWQLKQQIISYNSSGRENIPAEWREAIKIIDLLIATHKATPGARREAAKLLEDALEGQQTWPADDESAGYLPRPPVIDS